MREREKVGGRKWRKEEEGKKINGKGSVCGSTEATRHSPHRVTCGTVPRYPMVTWHCATLPCVDVVLCHVTKFDFKKKKKTKEKGKRRTIRKLCMGCMHRRPTILT